MAEQKKQYRLTQAKTDAVIAALKTGAGYGEVAEQTGVPYRWTMAIASAIGLGSIKDEYREKDRRSLDHQGVEYPKLRKGSVKKAAPAKAKTSKKVTTRKTAPAKRESAKAKAARIRQREGVPAAA